MKDIRFQFDFVPRGDAAQVQRMNPAPEQSVRPNFPGQCWRSAVYENKIVTLILESVGLANTIRGYRRDCEQTTGSRLLTLEWFHTAFSRFPMRLATPLNPVIQPGGIWDLYWKPFRSTEPFRSYLDHPLGIEMRKRGVHFGLVFFANGFTNLIMHDNLAFDRSADSFPRFQRPFGRKHTLYVLEPLDQVLRGIGNSWVEPQGSTLQM
jgi:hypothetical protein